MITLDDYWETGYREVEGWLDNRVRLPIAEIGRAQEAAGVAGGILEIGVHHGRFFLALATQTRPGEVCVAIDVFEEQGLNIDHSGQGSRASFDANVARYIGDSRQVHVIQGDSLALNAKDKLDLLTAFGAFRLISVDGGHMAEHVYNDMLFAMDVMASGGVVIVDDYYNSHWPGVHEGVCKLMGTAPVKLRPFCYQHNKLWFTDLSHSDRYFEAFRAAFAAEPHFKAVRMWGSPVVVFA